MRIHETGMDSRDESTCELTDDDRRPRQANGPTHQKTLSPASAWDEFLRSPPSSFPGEKLQVANAASTHRRVGRLKTKSLVDCLQRFTSVQ